MHYCIAIITDQFPTDDVLHEKLAPYNAEKYYEEYDKEREKEIIKEYPHFLWNFWSVGGRYCGSIKLKIDTENEEYGWQNYPREPRSGRLFRHALLEKMSENPPTAYFQEDDYYSYFGEEYEYLRVDGCKIRDAIDFDNVVLNCWGFIGRNNEVYTRDHWDRKALIQNDQFENEVKEAVKECEDCYITFVDINE